MMKELKASSLIEVLISSVIITMSISFAFLIYVQIVNKPTRLVGVANRHIDKILVTENYPPGRIEFDDFYIEINTPSYDQSQGDIAIVVISGYSNSGWLLTTRKQLICTADD